MSRNAQTVWGRRRQAGRLALKKNQPTSGLELADFRDEISGRGPFFFFFFLGSPGNGKCLTLYYFLKIGLSGPPLLWNGEKFGLTWLQTLGSMQSGGEGEPLASCKEAWGNARES